MERARLKLALDRLEAEQWSRFEQFASEFLVTDYPNLRTVASASGDQGRDAELFSPDGLPSVVLQYSVSKDWKTKIRDTAERVSNTLLEARVLIYVTNRPLLSQGDELKRELIMKRGLVLDVLDQGWFLDRFRGDPHREAVSEALAKLIVDPYLAGEGVLRRSAPVPSIKQLSPICSSNGKTIFEKRV